MVFSNFSGTSASIRLEQYSTIKIENDAASDVYIVCNGDMRKMLDDSAVVNGFKFNLYGWMPGVGSTMDILFIGDNGDTYTESSYLTVTEPQAPILPIIQYIVDWLTNEPTLSAYVKKIETVRKPHKFSTTRPQYLPIAPHAGVSQPQIGEVEVQYDWELSVIFIEDLREQTRKILDLGRHETFIYKLVNHITNNPTLSGTLGIVDIDITDVNMPDERLDNVYLHQSSVDMVVQVIPEYT
jgi:hypothetical protein